MDSRDALTKEIDSTVYNEVQETIMFHRGRCGLLRRSCLCFFNYEKYSLPQWGFTQNVQGFVLFNVVLIT